MLCFHLFGISIFFGGKVSSHPGNSSGKLQYKSGTVVSMSTGEQLLVVQISSECGANNLINLIALSVNEVYGRCGDIPHEILNVF